MANTYAQPAPLNKVLIGDGVNWVAGDLTPGSVLPPGSGTNAVLIWDGADWISSTVTYVNSISAGQLLYASGANALAATSDIPTAITIGGAYIYRVSGTDVAVADGGTGASDASGARTNLGLVIGTNVQAQDAELQALAGLTSASDALPYFTGVGTASTTTLTSAARTMLDDTTVAAMVDTLGGAASTGTGGIVRKTDAVLVTPQLGTPQSGVLTNCTGTASGLTAGSVTTNANLTGPITSVGNATTIADAELAAIAGLTSAADRLPYFTGSGTAALATFSAAARTVLDDTTVSAMVDTLGGTAAQGSGAIVRATSPTLVTPALGVATATSIALGGGTAFANYVVGTFTPTVTLVGGAGNTTPVYTTNTGRYTRIGNQVFVTVFLDGDGGAEGAGTGQINIALPIAVSASAPNIYMPAGYAENSGPIMNVLGLLSASATTIKLLYWSAATTATNITGAEQNNANRNIRLRFWYEV